MDVLHPTEAGAPDKPAGDTLMNNDNNSDDTLSNPPPASLRAHEDARELVRLVQCSQCSYPLRAPVTLPCGNSLCRQCLPPSHTRSNISYPAVASRQVGITCPFSQCQLVHPLDDCSGNVVLTKIMDAVKDEVAKNKAAAGSVETSMEEVMQWPDSSHSHDPDSDLPLEKGHVRTLPGGRLTATFAFAEMGELPFSSNITYHPVSTGKEQDPKSDEEILLRVKEACQKELDCHVCYNTMLDPVSAPCGHTFCRKCLARILDHSYLCPHCRRYLPLPSSLIHQQSNHTLVSLLDSLCPEQIAARKEAAAEEERSTSGLDVPLFVCTVGFPEMPMCLHVFEPRYRLMIRRALESNRQFGMVPYNEHGTPQGNLGRTQFMLTGIMLEIEQCRLLADGRSLLFCRGLYRFDVLAHDTLDGYVVGKVERHSDISLAEEEALEAQETGAALTHPPPDADDVQAQLNRMSTAQLMEMGVRFVQQAEEQAACWLRGSVRDIYGPRPTDPALFPYWFGSVAPIGDDEKYKLLPTTSVRERLKIVAKWIKVIENSRWFGGTSCTVL